MLALRANKSGKNEKAARISSRPFVAVGICTFQRTEPLIELLESIGAQTGQIDADVVILIVDNNPTPSVPQDRVRKSTPYNVRIVHEPRTGLVHARNRLFELAEETGADWLIGVDDDATVAKDWLAQWMQGTSKMEAKILLSDIQLMFSDAVSPFIPQRQFAQPAEGKPPRVLATGNYAISREVFARNGGLGLRFHPDFNHIGGEDAEFFLRAKRQHGIVLSGWPNARVYEKQRGHRLTLRYHLNRTLCTQMCGYYIAALHRKDHILKKPRPMAIMLTRRTIRSIGKGLAALTSGALTLPFDRSLGKKTIGIGLEHMTRAYAVVPYLFGKASRRYGVVSSTSTEPPQAG